MKGDAKVVYRKKHARVFSAKVRNCCSVEIAKLEANKFFMSKWLSACPFEKKWNNRKANVFFSKFIPLRNVAQLISVAGWKCLKLRERMYLLKCCLIARP